MKIELKAWIHEPAMGERVFGIEENVEGNVILLRIPLPVPTHWGIGSEFTAVFGVDRTEFRRALKALI
jgi:hypothetical protein